jgi:hypothetical protein
MLAKPKTPLILKPTRLLVNQTGDYLSYEAGVDSDTSPRSSLLTLFSQTRRVPFLVEFTVLLRSIRLLRYDGNYRKDQGWLVPLG